MESPFYKNNADSTNVVMYLEPYLNTYYKSYQNIITLSAVPTGPLAEMVKMIPFAKLSIFQEPSAFYSNPMNCTYALLRYPTNTYRSIKTADYFMGADDIPAIFSYLQTNGYTIDTNLTHMLHTSKVDVGGVSESKMSGNRKMICFFSRTG